MRRAWTKAPVAWALAAALAVVLAAAGAARAEGKLRVGVNADYAPFNYWEAPGKVAGFDIDIANALCATMRMQCILVVMDWEETIPKLLGNEIDAIVASMSITEERKKRVAFTNRYYRTPMRFVGPKDFKWPDRPEGLRGKKVGVLADTTADYYVRDHLRDIVETRLFKTQEELNRTLMGGGVDLMLADALAMWHFLTSAEGRAFEFVGAPLYVDQGIGIAVRPDDRELLARLNAALARIRVDGTYERINAKYFPFSIY
jgi:lysine-arginine-ornithine-binding protein